MLKKLILLLIINIGTMYAIGRGVTKNQPKAVEYFTKAATIGDAKAQYNLGKSYLKGIGVEKDLDEALKWFTRASDQGHETLHQCSDRIRGGAISEKGLPARTIQR